MPQDTPVAKVEATQNYGARIELGGEMFDDAYEHARAYADTSGATFVHPFEDERRDGRPGHDRARARRAAAGRRHDRRPDRRRRLGAGIAIAAKELKPGAEHRRRAGGGVRARSPAGRSHGFTIAEGIAVKNPGELTTSIVRDLLDDVVTVTDDEISQAIVLSLERAKLLVEGAGAAPLAALLADRVGGEGAGVVLLSGGNIDPSLLITVMRHGLTLAGRYLVVRTRIGDRPGELVKLLSRIAQERVNLVSVEHHREGIQLSVAETEVELTLSTRDEAHALGLLEAMQRWGYPVERLR